MYRTVDAKFWNDLKVKKLRPEAKLLMLYLFTNPHTHLCGLYYLPLVLQCEETGFKKTVLDTLWHTLSKANLAWFHAETGTVFVKNMFRYQGRGSKNELSALSQLQTLIDSPLVSEFVKVYQQFSDRLSDRLSEFRTPDQEQDKEQKKEKEQDGPPAPKVTVFNFHFPETFVSDSLRSAVNDWCRYLPTVKPGVTFDQLKLDHMMMDAERRGWSPDKLAEAISFSITKSARSICDPDDNYGRRSSNGAAPIAEIPKLGGRK